MHDYTRFQMCTAGRRTYKSEIIKRKIVNLAMQLPKTRYLLVAPVLSQAKTMWWSGQSSIVDLVPSFWVKKKSDTELVMKLANDSIIELGSADTIERKEGGFLHGCVIDEAGDAEDLEELWQRSILPQLMDTSGFLWFIGVPRSTTTAVYREMWEKYNDKTKYPDWACYTWSAEGVASQTEIELARQTVDTLTYQTEYLGQWADNKSGRAYYQFDKKEHVKNVEFNDNYPLFCSLDFNTSIMPISIGQNLKDRKFINVLDQSVTKHTNLHTAIPTLKEKLVEINGGNVKAAQQRKTFIYGDYTGLNNSVAAKGSAWDVVKEIFAMDSWNVEIKLRSNPDVSQRVAATNARLKSADGKIHMAISPKCEELIQDFVHVGNSELKKSKDKLEKMQRTHSSDGLGYMVNYEYPLRVTTMMNA